MNHENAPRLKKFVLNVIDAIILQSAAGERMFRKLRSLMMIQMLGKLTQSSLMELRKLQKLLRFKLMGTFWTLKLILVLKQICSVKKIFKKLCLNSSNKQSSDHPRKGLQHMGGTLSQFLENVFYAVET